MGTDKEKTLQHNWEITKRLHVTSLIILGRKEEVNEEKCTFQIASQASISPLLLPQITCNMVWRRNKGQVCSIHLILHIHHPHVDSEWRMCSSPGPWGYKSTKRECNQSTGSLNKAGAGTCVSLLSLSQNFSYRDQLKSELFPSPRFIASFNFRFSMLHKGLRGNEWFENKKF